MTGYRISKKHGRVIGMLFVLWENNEGRADALSFRNLPAE